MVANFGSHPLKKFVDLKELQSDKPLVCGEFWCGWFTNYGGSYNAGSSATQVASYLKEFIKMDAGFNFYMFHGGTNFGFSAGANCYGRYTPDITSYDYGAPLTEWGEYTEKYHLSREVLHKAQGLPMEELPPSPVTKVYDNVKLTEVAELKDCIDDFCIKRDSHLIYHMEHYGQNQGYILYSTEFSGNYADTTLTLSEVHDIAYVYVNGELRGRFNRLDVDYYKGGSDTYKIPLKAFNGTIRIDILVEAMGRVNYGDKLYDRKGVGEVKIADQRIYDWTVRSMEMESAPNINFSSKENAKENISYPAFFRGNFTAKEKGDTFIDLIGFVPMKYKDSVQEEYRKSIDALFDKMKITENEISTSEYRNMVAGMKDDPDAREKVRRERNTLTNKINKLREEINILENNIGFFSNSKQSELLKAEYEKKINRAKNDLKVLEAKLKIINER